MGHVPEKVQSSCLARSHGNFVKNLKVLIVHLTGRKELTQAEEPAQGLMTVNNGTGMSGQPPPRTHSPRPVGTLSAALVPRALSLLQSLIWFPELAFFLFFFSPKESTF